MTMSRMHKSADHSKLFVGAIEGFRYERHILEVFRDWAELAAAEVHQLPYHAGVCGKDEAYERVEADYLQVAKKYEGKDFDRFADMLGATRLALGAGYQDFLGHCYMQLEINNTWTGQFFTPFTVSYLLAQLNLAEVESHIEQTGGWFTLLEPACGSGGILIAAAQLLAKKKINATSSMFFHAIDIDRLCANMTYIQTGLLGLTGVVWHGDTLRMDMRSGRFTPAARRDPCRTHLMIESTKEGWAPPKRESTQRDIAISTVANTAIHSQ